MPPTADFKAYEAKVDKLCAASVQQMAKEAAHAKKVMEDIANDLVKKICKVEIPKQLSADEFNSIPDRVNASVQSNCKSNLNRNAVVNFDFVVDLKNKLLRGRLKQLTSIL